MLRERKISIYMDVSENGGTPKSSILIGFSMVFHYKPSHFGVPLFLETPIYLNPYRDPGETENG